MYNESGVSTRQVVSRMMIHHKLVWRVAYENCLYYCNIQRVQALSPMDGLLLLMATSTVGNILYLSQHFCSQVRHVLRELGE
jgi:hypothetical protein